MIEQFSIFKLTGEREGKQHGRGEVRTCMNQLS